MSPKSQTIFSSTGRCFELWRINYSNFYFAYLSIFQYKCIFLHTEFFLAFFCTCISYAFSAYFWIKFLHIFACYFCIKILTIRAHIIFNQVVNMQTYLKKYLAKFNFQAKPYTSLEKSLENYVRSFAEKLKKR